MLEQGPQCEDPDRMTGEAGELTDALTANTMPAVSSSVSLRQIHIYVLNFVNRYLGCFHILVSVNKGTKNMEPKYLYEVA